MHERNATVNWHSSRASQLSTLERMGVSVTFSGGALDGLQLTNRASVVWVRYFGTYHLPVGLVLSVLSVLYFRLKAAGGRVSEASSTPAAFIITFMPLRSVASRLH